MNGAVTFFQLLKYILGYILVFLKRIPELVDDFLESFV